MLRIRRSRAAGGVLISMLTPQFPSTPQKTPTKMIIKEFWSKCWTVCSSRKVESQPLARIIRVLRATPASQVENLATAVEAHHQAQCLATGTLKSESPGMNRTLEPKSSASPVPPRP